MNLRSITIVGTKRIHVHTIMSDNEASVTHFFDLLTMLDLSDVFCTPPFLCGLYIREQYTVEETNESREPCYDVLQPAQEGQHLLGWEATQWGY